MMINARLIVMTQTEFKQRPQQFFTDNDLIQIKKINDLISR